MSNRFNRERSTGISRREMLRQSSIYAAGLGVFPMTKFPNYWFRVEEVVVPFTDVPDTFTGRRAGDEVYPGQNLAAQDLRNLIDWVTPTEDFFAVAHYGYFRVDPGTYRLRIGGLVERDLSITLDELKRRRRVERTTVFECSGNSRTNIHGMVGNATWAGADLRELLAEARPTLDAREVHFWAADKGTEELRGAQYEQNFARSMSLADVLDRDPILAYEMNGQPLPIVHGFPVRLIVPGWYGVGQVKWLERIELAADRLMMRFMARDYVTIMGHEENGITRWVETSVTKQRVKSVIARVTRDGDLFKIFGVAWSDGTPIREVAVRVDDGEWLPATLDVPADPHTWTFFTLSTTGIPSGERRVVSRATDERDRTQPNDLSMKRTRWENNEIFERTIMVS